MRLLQLSMCLVAFWASIGLDAAEFPVLVKDSFEGDLSLWKFSDPDGTEPTWRIITAEGEAEQNRVLRSLGGSKFEPPHRSPWNLALVKDAVVGDCEITVRVQNTNYDAGDHRDLCIFWGYQDPAHLYYVHLGAKPDPHSCQIFIVNAADRKMITDKKSDGTPWDRDWHEVKVVRKVDTGDIAVYFDDMQIPAMTAKDQSFTWGRVGIGTFDDNGNFDDFELRGAKVEPIPESAKLPGE